MGDPKQERQLLGYLLGALDDRQRERIDQRLGREPGLAGELARVEESLECLRMVKRVHRPPRGLAARTCRRVFAYSQALAARRGEPPAARRPARELARAMSPTAVPPTSPTAWGWSDLLVAATVFLAIAGLLFPAIQSSRMNMRLVACQNNLREVGLTQSQFHERHLAGSAEGAGDSRRTVGVPYRSLLEGRAATAPVVPLGRMETNGTPLRITKSPRLAQRAIPVFPAGLAPGTAPHQGFSHVVGGQNLLFLDGHVTFVAFGPIAAPAADPSPPDAPLTNSWSSAGLDPAPDPTDLTPIILISRPGP